MPDELKQANALAANAKAQKSTPTQVQVFYIIHMITFLYELKLWSALLYLFMTRVNCQWRQTTKF